MSKQIYTAPQLKVVSFVVEQGYTRYPESTLFVNGSQNNDGFETMAPNQTEGQSLFGNAFSNN